MKTIINKILFGKDQISGLIALAVVGMIVLGCNCNKSLDLSNLGKNESNSTTVSNTSSDNSNSYSNSSKTSPKSVTPADASTGEIPNNDQLEALARETILDFNDSIQKGDFADFRSTVSKPFQKSASTERFNEAFKEFLTAKPDFSEVASLPATFTSTPVIERELGYKTLKYNGTFNTSPRPTKFELKYIPEGKDWKLIFIRVSTRDF